MREEYDFTEAKKNPFIENKMDEIEDIKDKNKRSEL